MCENDDAWLANGLYDWYDVHGRRYLPWVGEKDVYKIWLSEVILQQTRVSQGLPYYEQMSSEFPNVDAMNRAGESRVLKSWEGLGYYSRARNMYATAKYVSDELGGVFPDNYKDLIILQGVGKYTGAAIASFAFGEAVAVVDGNVIRVLSRLFGYDYEVDVSEGLKYIESLASVYLDKNDAGRYNQAIMDFGALQCHPGLPDCSRCPFVDRCVAYLEGKVSQLPKKRKKKKSRNRFFYYLVLRNEGRILIKKRGLDDIWGGLYDFPMIESERIRLKIDVLQNISSWGAWLVGQRLEWLSVSKVKVHKLTHQNLHIVFVEANLLGGGAIDSIPANMLWANLADESNFAFPKPINLYLLEH